MGRRLGLALLVAALLVGLGLGLQCWFVAPAPTVASDPVSRGAESLESPNSEARGTSVGALELEGKVEYRSPNEEWKVLERDTALDLNDEVRTGSGSKARLGIGPSVTVELSESTGINIAELSKTLSRIRLQDGRVVSEVKPDGGVRFNVQVQGTDATAATTAGRFAVMRRKGTAPVFAARSGNLDVSGAGSTVRLESGEQTVVNPGTAPLPPTKLPATLVLKLGPPPPSRMRTKVLNVSGETSPGAIVSIEGENAGADAQGRFTQSIALVEGSNEIVVEVEDVLGRQRSAKLPRIVVDAQPPRVKTKVVW